MTLKTKLLDRKVKPIEKTMEIDGVGEVTFQINSITLGQIMNHTETYPSLNSLINGVKLDGEDEDEKFEKLMDVLEAFNIVVALAVKIKDGKNWISFDMEPGEDALIPSEVLPQPVLLELGQDVIRRFRPGR